MLLIGIILILVVIGTVTFCCCKVAGEADRITDKIMRECDKNACK